ncbi:alpha/beta hydrolase [Gramella jeungdoensis]|uniref:Alpha/beta hydrolase n=2 Tax=Flavobacteriaceae TaxID=49546 RepID=A0A4Y8AQY2_9FLAO|nr:alpha/beta hydrolase [Gramella jeungdoensis]
MSTFSDTNGIKYIWPNGVPKTDEDLERSIQTKEKVGLITKIIEIKYPSFTVYKPTIKGNNVGIIVCPGGGYSILAIDLEGTEVAQWLTKLGYTVFLLKYSVPNKELEALNDLKRTIRIVRNTSAKYNLNKNKIGVLGFSAGGSLCARVSTLFNKETYTKVDEIDAVSCRPNFTLLIYPAYLDQGENNSITPELEISKKIPPMFIFGTVDDVYGNSSLVMTKALKEAEVTVELHFLDEGGHGYGLRKGNRAAEVWPKLAESWLKRIHIK